MHIKVEMIIQKAFCVRFSKVAKHLKGGFYLAYDLQYYLSIRCKNYSDKKKKTRQKMIKYCNVVLYQKEEKE